MPGQIIRAIVLAMIVASLSGGGVLVANVSSSEHVVAAGETLEGISRTRGVPLEELIALNGLADPNAIRAGQVLKLPVAQAAGTASRPSVGPPAGRGSVPAPPTTSEYVVRPGDSLSSIARALGVSIQALVEANAIADPNRLVAGQRLTIPGAAGRPSAGPAAPSDDPSAALLQRLAERHGLDAALVMAMAWPRDGVPIPLDRPGALGLLQVAAPTFEHVQQSILRRALDRASVEDNAEAGVAYLASLMRWAGGGDRAAAEANAVAAFVQGPGSVRSRGVLPETQRQVDRILQLRARLAQSPRPAAPTPTPTPAAEQLAAKVLAAVRATAGSTGRVGVAGLDLIGGRRLGIAADEVFPAASVAKLPILVEAYRQHGSGRRPLTEAARTDLQRMIWVSDNDAANRLIDLLGLEAINQAASALGLSKTRLVNRFGTDGPVGVVNATTPADMARLLELLITQRLVSPEADREMVWTLAQTVDGSKIRRGLPEGTRVAHKSGWYAGVANDVAIVSHGRSAYVLAVFTEGIADGEVANETIAAITRVVHDAWTKQP